MKVVQVNKDELNNFVGKQKHSQFLQSWEWGEFQQTVGNKVIHLGFTDNNKLVWAVTLNKKNLLFGKSYLYAPRIGIKYLEEDQLESIFTEIKKVAKNENSLFLRFEPRNKFFSQDGPVLDWQIVKTIDVQPSRTLILDLAKPEEELLKSMHHKTRYNIRLAAKRGVEMYIGNTEKDFEEFWDLMEETRERDKFRLHSRNYYQKMLEIDFITLLLAKYKGKVIAGNIVSFFGDMATYIHGASSNEHRNVMAPFALQWQAIKQAKEEGYKYYDFNGIDAKKWPGVTRFKKGFGGEEINYPGTFDLVFDKQWYFIYKLIRKMRRRF